MRSGIFVTLSTLPIIEKDFKIPNDLWNKNQIGWKIIIIKPALSVMLKI